MAEAGTSGVDFSAFPWPGDPPLPGTCFGGFSWRRAGKHSRPDGGSLSHHLEYITVILQSPPKRGLAMAKTNTILQQPWMHFQTQKQSISRLPETPLNVAAAWDTELSFDGSLRSV